MEVSLELLLVKGMKVLLVKRHIACPNRTERRRRRNREFSRFVYGLFTGVFGYFERTIVVRIALLEYSKIHEKAYKCVFR